jgi:hypothetical protein
MTDSIAENIKVVEGGRKRFSKWEAGCRPWAPEVEHRPRWGRDPILEKIRPNSGTGGFHRHKRPAKAL